MLDHGVGDHAEHWGQRSFQHRICKRIIEPQSDLASGIAKRDKLPLATQLLERTFSQMNLHTFIGGFGVCRGERLSNAEVIDIDFGDRN